MKGIEFIAADYAYPAAEQSSKALDRITLSIPKGEFVLLLGKSGSGKSTFVKLCNALLTPGAGTVRVHGIDTSDAAHLWEIRRRSGTVFADPDSQIIGTTVAEDVAFGPENLGVCPEVIRERVRDALTALDLQQFADTATHLLTKAQKVRQALAGVIAMQPDCLLLDDATALLPPADRKEILLKVRELCRERGLTVVHATRNAEDAAVADRVIVLDKGRIVVDIKTSLADASGCGFREGVGLCNPSSPEQSFQEADDKNASCTGGGSPREWILSGMACYLPGNSILHRSDPRTKIALTLLFMAAVFALRSFPSLALLLVATLALMSFASKTGQSFRGLKFVSYLAVVTTVINAVSIQGTPIADYGLLSHVSREALAASGTMVFRLLLLAGAGSLLTSTTTPLALTAGMERLLRPFRRLGVPVLELVTMLLIALRFLPVIMEEAEKLVPGNSTSAGAPGRVGLLQRIRSYAPLLVPLFAAVVRRAEALATAMDARCFRGGTGRTRMQPLAFTGADLACVAVVMLFLSALVVVEKVL